MLNRKVKHFEDQVAREEQRNRLQNNGDFEADNNLNDKYI